MGRKSREKKERKTRARERPRGDFLQKNAKWAGGAAGVGIYALSPLPYMARDLIDAIAFFIENTAELAGNTMKLIRNKTSSEVAELLGQERIQELFDKTFQEEARKHIEYLTSWNTRLRNLKQTYYSLAENAADNPISQSPVVKPMNDVYTEILEGIGSLFGKRQDIEIRATPQYHENMRKIANLMKAARKQRRELTEKELALLKKLSRESLKTGLEKKAAEESDIIEETIAKNSVQIKRLRKYVIDYNKLEKLAERADNLTTQEKYQGKANKNYQAVIGVAKKYDLNAGVQRPEIPVLGIPYGDAAAIIGGVVPALLGYGIGRFGGKIYGVGRKGARLSGKIGKVGIRTGKRAVEKLGNLGDIIRGVDRKK